MLSVLLLSLWRPAKAGYQSASLQRLLDAAKTVHGMDLRGLKMLDFGSQEIHDLTYDKHLVFSRHDYTPLSYAMGPFFTHIGVNYSSIDINGEHGAYVLDARHDLTFRIKDRFDIVSNMGFSEHVGEGDVEENLILNQYTMFRNMHVFGAAHSVFFHDLPSIGAWYQHGVCHYEPSFFKAIASAHDYELIFVLVSDYMGPGREVVSAAYQKTASSRAGFMSFDEFQRLPGIESAYSDWASNLNVTLSIPDVDDQFVQFHVVIVDVAESPTIQVAQRYCEDKQHDISRALRYTYDYDRCVSYVATSIDRHKIENSIRS
jgi:hypothetical protein